jgi:hypothetical protein
VNAIKLIKAKAITTGLPTEKPTPKIDVGRLIENQQTDLDRFAASSPSPSEKAEGTHAEQGEGGGFGDSH